ncbi:MAG: ATP-dependent 6-phosphofructokinase [Deltaproteobacteria bacterium]|jgi:6-phosphofructokinase 1|nr:ATP-dependent 6-phosphofructokinase [Deltaproteobacteria bacterium]
MRAKIKAPGKKLFNTAIDSLGPAKIPTKLPYHTLPLDASVTFHLDSENFEDLYDQNAVPVSFELGGPRENLYFDSSKAKCAIVTCGGLCPGINDVIRAIVMEATHNYRVPAILGIQYGLEGFIPSFNHDVRELSPERVSDIHLFGGTILGTSRGPQSAEEIVDALERMNISALFMIGGDGTMKATSKVVAEVTKRGNKISVIGIPKTIDNDINFISQSFGFETAVFKATEAIQCAHTEALGANNGIGLVKLMGRESGFIAAHATMASKEVNFVLVPEVEFRLDGEGGVLPALYQRLKDRSHAVVVLAEGAGQHLLTSTGKLDASGNPILGDIATLLRDEIASYLKAKDMPHTIKYIDPSYIIRSVPANANDKVYCGLLGQNAVHAAMAGKTDMVVAKLMDRYVHIPLDLVTQKRRKLDVRSGYWSSVLESTGQSDLYGMIPGKNQGN